MKEKDQAYDKHWMELALQLAGSAKGQTSPNPMVGAVAVKKGELIGSGAHLKAGTPHAEVHALQMAGDMAKGSTLYVTLEPCNHMGCTPPCTERIIQSGVKRVVIGSKDPDPRVSGEGIRRLQNAGIEVELGVLAEPCDRLNEAYFHHRRTGTPFVCLKAAITLDGKIATPTGDSRWVTGKAAREEVHRLRHQYDAILVGSKTVLNDHPRLTARVPGGGKNPLRVILDSYLRLPIETPVTDVETAPTWIFCTNHADQEKERILLQKGVRVIRTGNGPRVHLAEVFKRLGNEGVISVLAESGGELNASLLREGWVNKVIFFIAPKILGGKESPTAVEGDGPQRMGDAWALQDVSFRSFGEDLCLIGYPRRGKEEG
ncbi:bifunctional diaminohydroxyphosphoribosylaminopyrimidine deaminase/5-amino-6-(5-phosphoribosylamino)uracil reductase RibD [Melghirimyces algeriensis]|uniref:Riboflavin biosynthesis protein RibD n=1 Tax=Melghirimyces algeriensis TaxID=910412 RepID=A0A521B263_9BACL|nr:bifunctional diaminohydroxyphosphoribosylaminopyrimidine deaminase/5-amino-6-(5-phosphoribosylamino)uracil reductase RibD [Melghirimyces algeriensis]SMO41194.1 diaminohydroxyphosphoribosylaminopyrimidine deaminase [Melghirimyces algeriensis]